MLVPTSTIIILFITCILFTILLIHLFYKKKAASSQINNIFILICVLMLFWLINIILQASLSTPLNINPIYFDYFVYISACILPVLFFLFSVSFSNTKFKFNKNYKLLFLVPLLSLVILWTNDFHHLFYKQYSININETVLGPYTIVHTIYSYALMSIGLIKLLFYTIKNSGFFSKQSIFIFLGVLIPVVINILGSFGIIEMTIYITPISFAIAIFFFALAIFKFDFLKVAPIALQRIVDRMSDSYIVVNENNVVTDFNQTFLDLFKVKSQDIRNKNLEELFDKYNKFFDIKKELILGSVEKAKQKPDTIVLEEPLPSIDKYFHIEINSITNKGSFLGVLILLKDITQHMKDLKTIEDNQDMLIEKERLASLGQMIGGIAHNLKTPIMSIAGASEGLSDLIKEYDLSIGDPEVTFEDHHAIAKDMFDWVSKIKTHTSYMSDVITAVKGQAVALSGEMVEVFTVEELMKRVNILMRHELKNALVELNFEIEVPSDFELKGNINSLIQVINNMISNSIQSYEGKPNQSIDLIIKKQRNNIVISVKDYGPGLPYSVKEKLFKEMVTTKGKNGTGLGLFMSYSNIRAHFNGNITVESEKDKGTQFNIILPLE